MSETAPHSSDSLLSSAATASEDQASGSRDDSSSSTMMMMTTLVQMNNDGVFYLEHGYFQEAIQTWSTALRLAMTGEEDESDMSVAAMPVAQKRQQQRRRGNPTPNSTTNKGNFEQPSRVSSSPSNRRRRRRHRNNNSAPSVPPSVVTEDCESSSHDHLRCPHVYTTPIRIVDRYDLPSIPRLILLCTFNLALANHMELMTTNHNHDTAWRHVLKLYKVVHTLQIQFEDVQHDVDDIIPAFDVPHSLGLINNVAVVYHILGRHTKADTCWHHLLSTVLCLVDQQQQQELVNCEDMDGYLENMWHLVVDEKTTVPVANAA